MQMRCPSCGTDNAPDSRFCGGCGARLTAADPRVAPTQKIADDARFPQRPPLAPAAAPITAPGVAMPRGMPPTPFVPQAAAIAPNAQIAPPQRPLAAAPAGSIAPAPLPQRASTAPPAAAVLPVIAPPRRPITAAPEAYPGPGPKRSRPPALIVDDPSRSLPVPARRPWALIVVVLMIDVGLALSGAWMLYQGLGGTTAAGVSTPQPR